MKTSRYNRSVVVMMTEERDAAIAMDSEMGGLKNNIVI